MNSWEDPNSSMTMVRCMSHALCHPSPSQRSSPVIVLIRRRLHIQREDDLYIRPASLASMGASPAGIRLSVWMAVFTGITTAVIALRIWAVHLTRRSLQLSDYLVIVAYVCVEGN